MGESLNRREFLGTTAAGGAFLAAGGLGAKAPTTAPATAPEAEWPRMPAVKIHKVYAGTSGGAWPGPKFNATTEIARYEKLLAQAEGKLDNVKFVGGQQVKTASEAAKVAENLGDADAVLVFDLNFHDGRRVAPLVSAGLPTAIFVYPFSGHQWMYYSQWQEAGKKLMVLPTSDYGRIERAASLLAVPGRMKKTRILVVGRPRGTKAACTPEEVKKRLGCEMVAVTNREVIEAHKAVDPKAAEAEARKYWIGKAEKIVEPPKAAIVNSARLFLAVKKLMADRGAQATTSSHCMGAPAKCCLTYSKLNDLGLVGACEGDMDSTLTMLIFRYAFGVPGFISDPLFDFAKNSVIHAHCTCTTTLDGPGGERAPFVIRTQCDSERGVSLEVRMRVGQEITCAKLANAEAMLISTGKITEIPDYYDRGCRTQITTEVRDARKMYRNWGGKVLPNDMMTLLHRVVFYGNHLQDVRNLSLLMGLKVVEEG